MVSWKVNFGKKHLHIFTLNLRQVLKDFQNILVVKNKASNYRWSSVDSYRVMWETSAGRRAHFRTRCAEVAWIVGAGTLSISSKVRRKITVRSEVNVFAQYGVCSHYLCYYYVENYEISLLNKPLLRDKTNRTPCMYYFRLILLLSDWIDI